jgi:hypothetical protein
MAGTDSKQLKIGIIAPAQSRWNKFIAHFRFPCFGPSPFEVLQLPSDLHVDVHHGLPGDIPCDFTSVFSTITSVMDKVGVPWCVVGDVLLAHYRVPKVTAASATLVCKY